MADTQARILRSLELCGECCLNDANDRQRVARVLYQEIFGLCREPTERQLKLYELLKQWIDNRVDAMDLAMAIDDELLS